MAIGAQPGGVQGKPARKAILSFIVQCCIAIDIESPYMSFIMQRTISPQLALSAALSVLAMAVFAVLAPATPGEATQGTPAMVAAQSR